VILKFLPLTAIQISPMKFLVTLNFFEHLEKIARILIDCKNSSRINF